MLCGSKCSATYWNAGHSLECDLVGHEYHPDQILAQMAIDEEEDAHAESTLAFVSDLAIGTEMDVDDGTDEADPMHVILLEESLENALRHASGDMFISDAYVEEGDMIADAIAERPDRHIEHGLLERAIHWLDEHYEGPDVATHILTAPAQLVLDHIHEEVAHLANQCLDHAVNSTPEELAACQDETNQLRNVYQNALALHARACAEWEEHGADEDADTSVFKKSTIGETIALIEAGRLDRLKRAKKPRVKKAPRPKRAPRVRTSKAKTGAVTQKKAAAVAARKQKQAANAALRKTKREARASTRKTKRAADQATRKTKQEARKATRTAERNAKQATSAAEKNANQATAAAKKNASQADRAAKQAARQAKQAQTQETRAKNRELKAKRDALKKQRAEAKKQQNQAAAKVQKEKRNARKKADKEKRGVDQQANKEKRAAEQKAKKEKNEADRRARDEKRQVDKQNKEAEAALTRQARADKAAMDRAAREQRAAIVAPPSSSQQPTSVYTLPPQPAPQRTSFFSQTTPAPAPQVVYVPTPAPVVYLPQQRTAPAPMYPQLPPQQQQQQQPGAKQTVIVQPAAPAPVTPAPAVSPIPPQQRPLLAEAALRLADAKSAYGMAKSELERDIARRRIEDAQKQFDALSPPGSVTTTAVTNPTSAPISFRLGE